MERKEALHWIRVYGCVAYAMVSDEQIDNFDVKGTKCLLLDYCEGTKAYMLLCLKTKKS